MIYCYRVVEENGAHVLPNGRVGQPEGGIGACDGNEKGQPVGWPSSKWSVVERVRRYSVPSWRLSQRSLRRSMKLAEFAFGR